MTLFCENANFVMRFWMFFVRGYALTGIRLAANGYRLSRYAVCFGSIGCADTTRKSFFMIKTRKFASLRFVHNIGLVYSC